MAGANLIESLKIDYIKLAKEIWTSEFSSTNISPPELEIQLAEEVKSLAHRILLSCYLPSSLISEDSNEQLIDYFSYPDDLFNHFKLSLKNKLPSFLNKLINVRYKKVPITRWEVTNKIGVHPSYFDIKHSLSKIYYMR